MTNRYYHGARTEFGLRDLITPAVTSAANDAASTRVLLTANLDEAIWSAELAAGDAPARVYVVEPLGPVARLSEQPGYEPPGHLSMSWCSREPLRVMSEVTEWLHYHGTRADLRPGDLIKPGHIANYGATVRTANYVYFTRTLDAAMWGAELAAGEARGRIYIVEPTGPIEDDPNLTNKKFRGNPTKSFRARAPVRITGEITDWQGHGPEAIQAMRDGLEQLKRLGAEAIDD
jgi:rifampin ADP-ribosylating transferase